MQMLISVSDNALQQNPKGNTRATPRSSKYAAACLDIGTAFGYELADKVRYFNVLLCIAMAAVSRRIRFRLPRPGERSVATG